jgi:Tfp pilus assembly protein PilO
MNLNLPKNFIKYSNPALTPTKQSYSSFEIILLVVVAALVFWFLIQPKRAELADKKTTLTALQKEKTELKSNADRLEKLVKQLKNSKEDVAKLDEMLPLDVRETKVHLLVEDLIKNSGLTSSNVSVTGLGDKIVAGNPAQLEGAYTTPRKVQEIDISMVVTGNFAQLMAFLGTLEKSARIMDVSFFEITASDDDTLDFSLNVSTYYFYE